MVVKDIHGDIERNQTSLLYHNDTLPCIVKLPDRLSVVGKLCFPDSGRSRRIAIYIGLFGCLLGAFRLSDSAKVLSNDHGVSGRSAGFCHNVHMFAKL